MDITLQLISIFHLMIMIEILYLLENHYGYKIVINTDILFPGWGDTLHNTVTSYGTQPRFKCGRSLPIYSTLTMGAGHYSRPLGERLLPRRKAPTLQSFNMTELLQGKAQPSHKIVKAQPSHKNTDHS
jgi:hypothetical protein